MRHLGSFVLILFGLGVAAADSVPPREVVHLVTGDRVSGKIIARGTKRIRIQTPYGLLVIPKSDIARIVSPDGAEEILASPPEKPAENPATTTPPRVRLSLVVKGASFWQAWDSRAAPVDPSLRLILRIDEQEIAAWSDAILDEGEIKGAIVNAFSFEPGTLVCLPVAEGASAPPPAANPGRIVLNVELPATWVGSHRIGVAYQSSEATGESRAWRDLAWTVGNAELALDRVTVLTLSQDRGTMEYSGFGRRRMKNVEMFRLALGAE